MPSRLLQAARRMWRSVGLAGFLGMAVVAPGIAGEMEFRLAPFGDQMACGRHCPEVIGATGEIMASTPQKFFEFVKRNIDDPRLRSIVLIHSPGGSVVASMQLGEMFRKTGVAVVVAHASMDGVLTGSCYSACVYAFLGGVKRVAPPGSRIGIHRMSFEEYERDLNTLEVKSQARFSTPEMVARLSGYAASMGVSRDLIAQAERISPSEIHIITPNELRKWRLGVDKF